MTRSGDTLHGFKALGLTGGSVEEAGKAVNDANPVIMLALVDETSAVAGATALHLKPDASVKDVGST